jgi:Zn finger protein HypA/HybF involved in hydrogenase expression
MSEVKRIITLVKSFVWCWKCGDRQDFEMREDHKWHCKQCGSEWK